MGPILLSRQKTPAPSSNLLPVPEAGGSGVNCPLKTTSEVGGKIIIKWEKAIKEEVEIITMGDLNLNTLRWDTPQHLKSQYDRTKDPMIQSLQTRILDKGFTILSQTPTKVPDNPKTPPPHV